MLQHRWHRCLCVVLKPVRVPVACQCRKPGIRTCVACPVLSIHPTQTLHAKRASPGACCMTGLVLQRKLRQDEVSASLTRRDANRFWPGTSRSHPDASRCVCCTNPPPSIVRLMRGSDSSPHRITSTLLRIVNALMIRIVCARTDNIAARYGSQDPTHLRRTRTSTAPRDGSSRACKSPLCPLGLAHNRQGDAQREAKRSSRRASPGAGAGESRAGVAALERHLHVPVSWTASGSCTRPHLRWDLRLLLPPGLPRDETETAA